MSTVTGLTGSLPFHPQGCHKLARTGQFPESFL